MADTEMQKAQAASQAGAELQEKEGKQDVSQLLKAFGGFNAIRGFMPDADNMNPARKAAKQVFLTDKRFKDKREGLKKDIKRWLELLDDTSIESATGFADACKQDEEKFTNVLKQGITDALYATQNLERSYRQLDSFFKTCGTDKVINENDGNSYIMHKPHPSNIIKGYVMRQVYNYLEVNGYFDK